MDRKQGWVLIEKDAREKPELCQVADKLEISLDVCFSRWFRLWNWIDDQFPDGKLAGITFRALDQVSGIAGLAEALSDVGWIRPIEGGLEVPDFEERWGRIAVRRYLWRMEKREQRRSRERASDAAAVENLSTGTDRAVENLSTDAELEGEDSDKSRTMSGTTSGTTSGTMSGTTSAPRADLRSLDPLFLKTLRSIDRLESIERKEFDWEKVLEHALKIHKWIGCARPLKDRGLVLRACVLAQTRLSEAWLWQALEAVREHGPNKPAAYFRKCLVNGLAQFVGPLERNQLAQLYARLEKLVPISDAYVAEDLERRKARREQAG